MIRLGQAVLALVRRLRGRITPHRKPPRRTDLAQILWPGPGDNRLVRVAFALVGGVSALWVARAMGLGG